MFRRGISQARLKRKIAEEIFILFQLNKALLLHVRTQLHADAAAIEIESVIQLCDV